MTKQEARIAVIGGSGFYDFPDLEERREEWVETPFGQPSDAIVTGRLAGRPVAFLPRHGRGHRISPTELPARANIYALKQLGVEYIVSVSACGSMKEEIAPLDVVIPNQLFDRTKARVSTFFDGGIVAHVSFADPFCADLGQILFQAATRAGARVHSGGTYICMEGPQFSTRAESRIYRQWGVDVIGMTALPEAKLAREAEICYATLAFVTDYDCWHETEEDVTVEMVIKTLLQNVETGKQIIREALPHVGEAGGERACPCASALENAILTQRDLIPPQAKARLGILVRKYLGE
ncbi:MAG: 5'-methylthioadenosine phosphorylase [uncultured Chloroflexi bacterium]|uniref:S-methyl-5'-thioadenosine phosphorylase n=1 Tax=uncultured Chloroflexota bacterium TaxID=166587 RepID=A0A6J4KAT6_9CHLR|nr:MAG: 5'-methylthioadenosine phosphorylase [uncultured Chloroflexota bacterium]